MSFTAAYPGTCVNCPGPIVPGQQIETAGLTEYRHVTCPEPRVIPSIERGPGETVCTSCWLVHKGECF